MVTKRQESTSNVNPWKQASKRPSKEILSVVCGGLKGIFSQFLIQGRDPIPIRGESQTRLTVPSGRVDSLTSTRRRSNRALCPCCQRRSASMTSSLYQAMPGSLSTRWVCRKHDTEIVLYSAGGMPVEDVAWATEVYRTALERGIGIKLNLWESPALA